MEASSSRFYVAIQGILKSWTALQLAVSHGFGGSESAEKAQWMVGVIEEFFKNNDDVEDWELEEFISQIMNEEFNTVLEDDSLSSVAKEIVVVYDLWSLNKTSELNARLQSLPQVNLSECVSQCEKDKAGMSTVQEQDELSSLSNSMNNASMDNNNLLNNDNINESKSMEDADGWTTVTTRSRTRRK